VVKAKPPSAQVQLELELVPTAPQDETCPADFMPDRPREAPWLHSTYDAPVWVVEDDDRRPGRKTREIDFRYMLPDGSEVTDPINQLWLDTARHYAWHLRQAEVTTKGTRQEFLVRNLLNLMSWTVLRGKRRFSELLPADIAALQEEAAFGAPSMLRYYERMEQHLSDRAASGIGLPSRREKYGALIVDQDELCRQARLNRRATMFCGDLVHRAALSEGLRPASPTPPKQPKRARRNWVMVADMLVPLQHLYDLRETVTADSTTFAPFPNKERTKGAKALGAAVGRTPTPPSRQYMVLLDASMRWVADYGPELLEALRRHRSGDVHQPPAELVAGPNSPWPLAPTRQGKGDRIDLDTAILFLVAACYVVIGTFSARRRSEILDLQRGCIRGSAKDGFWLGSYIAKTIRDDDETPCPACVALAVQLLEQLGGEEDLFKWRTPFGAVRKLEPNKAVRRFARFIRLPPQEDGSEWSFGTHQLRRMFAILYVRRWHFGDLESLSHHLRHFDLNMTKRYLTVEDHVELDAEQRKLTYEVALEVATGARAVGGKAGVRLKQMMARLRGTLQVHTPDRLPKIVSRVIERTQVLVKMNPWSYCLSPNTEAAAGRARCQGSGRPPGSSGPNLAQARPEVCSGCTFNLTDARFTPFIEREIDRAERTLKGHPGGLLLHALEDRLTRLRDYVNDINAAKAI